MPELPKRLFTSEEVVNAIGEVIMRSDKLKELDFSFKDLSPSFTV